MYNGPYHIKNSKRISTKIDISGQARLTLVDIFFMFPPLKRAWLTQSNRVEVNCCKLLECKEQLHYYISPSQKNMSRFYTEVRLSVGLSFRPSVCLYGFLSVCLSVRPSVRLSSPFSSAPDLIDYWIRSLLGRHNLYQY